MKAIRDTGIVVCAERGFSYSVRRDDGLAVSLSPHEAHATNYRLEVGDKIAFDVRRGGDGKMRAYDVVLLTFDRDSPNLSPAVCPARWHRGCPRSTRG